ncbi:MAG: hypothetical protein AB1502_01845 [Thermodesulfobacteriota bacterium]
MRLSFAKTKVDVCLLEDNRIFVLDKDKVVAESVFSKDNKTIKKEKKIERLLNQREHMPVKIFPKKTYIPPAEHPWRKSFAKWIKLREEAKKIRGLAYERQIEKNEIWQVSKPLPSSKKLK